MEETKELTAYQQEEVQVGKRALAKKATHAALVVKIKEAYQTYMKSNDETFSLAIAIENRRIALGTYIHEAKELVGHGKFKLWFEANCKDIGYSSAKRYMQFAKAANYKQLDNSVHNLTEYKKVLVNLGLREPEAGAVQQLADYNYFAVFTNTARSAILAFNKILQKQPIDTMEEEAREQLKEQLAPLIAIYEEL